MIASARKPNRIGVGNGIRLANTTKASRELTKKTHTSALIDESSKSWKKTEQIKKEEKNQSIRPHPTIRNE